MRIAVLFLAAATVVAQERPRLVPQLDVGYAVRLEYVAGDKFVLGVTRQRTGVLWDAGTGREIRRLPSFLDVTGDARLWLAKTGDATAELRDATGRRVRRIELPKDFATARFSADGKRIVSASHAGEVWIVSVRGRRSLRFFVPRQSTDHSVGHVALSPDARMIVTGTSSGSVHLWDARSGKLLHRYPPHRARIEAVAFAPDNSRIASADLAGIARVADTRSGKVLCTVEAPDADFRVVHPDEVGRRA